ncbi:MAG: WD40 repeat domain-containing protein [Candidatus Sigynarchaeum springense]
MQEKGSPVNVLAPSPADNAFASGSEDGKIQLWRL